MVFTPETVMSLLALIISILLATYNWYNSNRLKRLEWQLDIQKNKSVLNDKRNREIFDNFIELYVDILFNNKNIKDKNIEKSMLVVKKLLLINWSWKLIKEFNNFMFLSQMEIMDNKKTFNSFERLIRIFREDIWVNNDWLEKLELLNVFVKWKINI